MPEPVRVLFRAPATCPGAESFVRELTTRTPHARVAGDSERARTFDVAIEGVQGSEPVRGTMTTTDLAGKATSRELSGERCEEVVSGLALVAALTIEEARARDTAAPPSSAPAPSRPATATTPLPDDAPPPLLPPPTPQPPPDAVTSLPSSSRRARSGTSSWHVALGAEGNALRVTSTSAYGAGGFFDLATDDPGVIAPSFRIALWWAETTAALPGGTGARFDWFVARLEGCPLSPKLAISLRLSTCAFIDGGALRSAGRDITTPTTDVRRWVAPGALVRLTWALPANIDLEGTAAVLVPLRADHYRVADGSGSSREVDFVRIPGIYVAFGAAYRFE